MKVSTEQKRMHLRKRNTITLENKNHVFDCVECNIWTHWWMTFQKHVIEHFVSCIFNSVLIQFVKCGINSYNYSFLYTSITCLLSCDELYRDVLRIFWLQKMNLKAQLQVWHNPSDVIVCALSSSCPYITWQTRPGNEAYWGCLGSAACVMRLFILTWYVRSDPTFEVKETKLPVKCFLADWIYRGGV